MLPASAEQSSVTDLEQRIVATLAKDCPTAQSVHGGLLLLGVAREAAKVDGKAREAFVLGFKHDVVGWRIRVGADQILQEPLAEHLEPVQVPSQIFGVTSGGLPVVVESAASWLECIAAAIRLGVTPQEFASGRIRWSERCLQRMHRDLLARVGNGQFVLVMDFRGVRASFSDLTAAWPFIKAAISGVALRYTGCCRRSYIVHPPQLFSWSWHLLESILPAQTKAKICVLPGRTAPPTLADFVTHGDSLVAMTPESLPTHLGGVRTVAEMVLHNASETRDPVTG